ncbi:uroporphyrinogen-III synthase [Cytobacillus massiliigabonensis]|uniref:uroporphyrinogen-III synthase n=1 Tax=Cytobacillus massiliigabonensis TaxID=1871011 RepID=UPI000C82D7E3|nr:uroporphyrinogen-III synthase [Cytobacillus massiliigabonensis]
MTASSLPLKGKNILVPRSKGQAQSFSDLVEKYGGNPVEIPLLAFRPASSAENHAIINQLHTYDWLIFTSSITVETFLSFLHPSDRNHMPKIAAIGKKTESYLLAKGLQVDFTPQEFVAEGFVEEFKPYVKMGMKVLIPKGNLARNYIAAHLTKHGAVVDEAVIYETYFPEDSRELIKDKLSCSQLDILTFTSPSTIDHLMAVVKENNLYDKVEACIIGCIGPVTKERIEAYGLKVHIAPDVYTVHHMIKSTIDYLENEYRRAL